MPGTTGSHQVSQWDDRTVRLLGSEAVGRLAQARMLVVGVGGVGGYAAEMLARAGVGHLRLIDADNVDITNVNRQLIATLSVVGQPKAELLAERFRDINPNINVEAVQDFITPENVAVMLDEGFDFVLDAIDTVAPKVALITHCLRHNIPIISSMGAGGRTDPTKVGYADLWETREDGLARAVRQRLRKAGLRRPLKTVCSSETPHTASLIEVGTANKRTSYGTLATIPALFGIFMANYAIMRTAR
ncbi:MAG: tRNA threonylcarbamoyladenosine dehydratase [Muribaculaceae bacterium]|nr:tRNA threonylcarbamoyladenosine dehydratase [Bacteroides sp.]MDE6680084.1 tRNA threonylcarbamoyladenosine dehydratase [Muribaculaceae bacterium]MDE7190518.1 tRNA threonylcarbamoyladenosine dehydratase [Muribaculaceae bacterium]